MSMFKKRGRRNIRKKAVELEGDQGSEGDGVTVEDNVANGKSGLEAAPQPARDVSSSGTANKK